MMTAEQARTLACATTTPGDQMEPSLAALRHLERQHDIDNPKRAKRLVVRACALRAELLKATGIQLLSAKNRRLDYIPIGAGDCASEVFHLAIALANGMRAKRRMVLADRFAVETPNSGKSSPTYRLSEISMDTEGCKRALGRETLPMSEWSPENLAYQRLLLDCSQALDHVEWLAQRPRQEGLS